MPESSPGPPKRRMKFEALRPVSMTTPFSTSRADRLPQASGDASRGVPPEQPNDDAVNDSGLALHLDRAIARVVGKQEQAGTVLIERPERRLPVEGDGYDIAQARVRLPADDDVVAFEDAGPTHAVA